MNHQYAPFGPVSFALPGFTGRSRLCLKIAILGSFMLVAGVACTPQSSPPTASPQPTTPTSPLPPAATAPPKVGEFSLNQLTGRGCGMTLWKRDRANQQQFVFFNGLGENAMEMMINGKMQTFKRMGASGQEFYGQKTTQTFLSADERTQVDVNVALGTKGEIESVGIKNGTIEVTTDGQAVTITVVGDAGC